MEFLDYSQTFIGVLTSLVVLCIITSGNFIHEIIDKAGDEIGSKIQELKEKTDIKAIYGGVQNLAAHKLLQRFIKDPYNGCKLSDKDKERYQKLCSEGLELEMKIQTTFDELRSSYSPNFIVPARSLINDIKESRIHLIAPLFVLLYCLCIFICDELIKFNPLFSDGIVTFLLLFSLLSSMFWLMVWKHFYRSINIKIHPKPRVCLSSKKLLKIYCAICKHIEIKCRYFEWIIIMFLIGGLLYILMMLTSEFQLWLRLLIVVGIGILLPLIIIVPYKTHHKHKANDSLYLFVFKHFVGLCLIAIGMTIPFMFNSNICIPYQDYTAIKFIIIAFIIVNGLILPMTIPIRCFYLILDFVNKEIQTQKQKFQIESNRVVADLNKFCSKIQ